jgi:hypothetical protein
MTSEGILKEKKNKLPIKESGLYKFIFDSLHESALALDKDLKVLFANSSFYSLFKAYPSGTVGHSIFELGSGQWEIPLLTEQLHLPDKSETRNFEAECFFTGGGCKTMLIRICPIAPERSGTFFLVSFEDITEQKLAEIKRGKLIDQLQEALGKVNLLSGMLPICSYCKKIRDDRGSWNQIESYICQHSDAEFSHGICPGCAKEFYPQYFKS